MSKKKNSNILMENTHAYKNYNDYVAFQLKKTSDKTKQKNWLGEEWRLKIDIFKNLFNQSNDILKLENKKDALCLGSRTGQEVVALQELGIQNVIGIDLHEFKPYTIKGDIHDLSFADSSFDFVFSNILDHSLYPEKFVSEAFRVLKPNGVFVLHYQFDTQQDKYTEVIIKDESYLLEIFHKFEFISKKKIRSGKIAMNREIVFKKSEHTEIECNQ